MYLERLRADEAEAKRLFNDLLVSVTSFFRDTDAFHALRELAVPRLFEPAGRQDPVRVWVAGCATGEEAYSIAMLIREYAATAGALPAVHSGATLRSSDGVQRVTITVQPLPATNDTAGPGFESWRSLAGAVRIIVGGQSKPGLTFT